LVHFENKTGNIPVLSAYPYYAQNYPFFIFVLFCFFFFFFNWCTLIFFLFSIPRSSTDKFILEDLLSSVLSQFKEYNPSGSLKFNYLGIFQSLKLRMFMKKKNPFNSSEAEFHSRYFGPLWVKNVNDIQPRLGWVS